MNNTRHLRVVMPAAPEEQIAQFSQFCSHCGCVPEGPLSNTRVCDSCGLGVILEADSRVAPGPGDAFLVVDPTLHVSGMSRRAEELVGFSEPEAVDRHITEFFVPADAAAPGPELLVREILNAAGGASLPIVLRSPREFGVRMFGNLAACGPRRAVLLTFTDS